MSHLERSLHRQKHQKHPGQLARERDLTFKVHPLQLFVDRKQGQICSFENRGVGGRINGCLIYWMILGCICLILAKKTAE